MPPHWADATPTLVTGSSSHQCHRGTGNQSHHGNGALPAHHGARQWPPPMPRNACRFHSHSFPLAPVGHTTRTNPRRCNSVLVFSAHHLEEFTAIHVATALGLSALQRSRGRLLRARRRSDAALHGPLHHKMSTRPRPRSPGSRGQGCPPSTLGSRALDKIKADLPWPPDPNMHVEATTAPATHADLLPDSHRAGPTGKVREAAPPLFGTTLTRFVAPEGGKPKVFHPSPHGRPGEVYMYYRRGGVA